MQDQFDLVVVGAGYSGLAAARRARRLGLSVCVLEARDRVGGRVETTHELGPPIDLGGMWVGPGQDRILALAAEYDAPLRPTPTAGDLLWVGDRGPARFTGSVPPLRPHDLAAVAVTVGRIECLARRVDPARPWDAPDADRLDELTAAAWVRRATPFAEARDLVTGLLRTVCAADPDELSMLSLLALVASAGSLRVLLATEGGAQQDLFVEGADVVARRMAAELGDAVLLSHPVEAISQDDRGVTVESADRSFRGERVVVALPPPLTARLRYEPALPARRDLLVQRMPMGSVHKVYAAYEAPFWRAKGLNGEVLAADGLVTTAFDLTSADGPALLCSLVVGESARAFGALDVDERRREVLEAFTRWFGPEAGRPTAFVERSWIDERWSRGGYFALSSPGAVTSFGPALRAPVGRIHWAGTETAIRWAGYIDGAVRAGERAAAEAAAAMRTPVGSAAGL